MDKLSKQKKQNQKRKIRKKLKKNNQSIHILKQQELREFLQQKEIQEQKDVIQQTDIDQNKELPKEFDKIFQKFYEQKKQNQDSQNIQQTEEQKETVQEDIQQQVQKKVEKTKKQLKEEKRNQVAQLKALSERPDLVESYDVNSSDPFLLLYLKGLKSTVEVPKNWEYKKKQFFFKKGLYKQLYKLPVYIENTGISKLRDPLAEKNTMRMIRIKLKERMNPKLGKIDIDYDVLHDAFFKYQTKPKISQFGDIYYEGREEEQKMSKFKPGAISQELRDALGIQENEHPPWIYNMQKFGKPPSYPNMQIPGMDSGNSMFQVKNKIFKNEEKDYDENFLWGQMKNIEEQKEDEQQQEQGIKEFTQNEYMNLYDAQLIKKFNQLTNQGYLLLKKYNMNF